MNKEKFINFISEIGTIMYVGGILSHIIIGAVGRFSVSKKNVF